MKKFFSLLCAFAIVMSANAATFQLQKGQANRPAKSEVKFAKAPKAALEAEDIEIEVVETEYYASYGIYLYTLVDGDGTIYYFSFNSTGADPVVNGQTYTLADMASDYCYYDWYGYGMFQSPFVTATFVKNVDAAGHMSIEATISDEYEYEYNLHYAEVEVVPTGTVIPVAIDDLEFTDNQATKGWWMIDGYSADSTYYVALSNKTDTTRAQAVGTYDFANDMDKLYCYLYVNDDKLTFASGSVVVSQNADGTYHIEASLLAKTGDQYNFTLNSKFKKVSENVITMNYDATTRSLSIATTNNDPYFFYIETKDAYDSYQSDFSQASLNEEADDWISTMVYYSVLEDYTLTGNATIDVVEFFGTYAATDDYVALAAPVEDGERNGEAAYKLFHFDYPEAIENTEAETINTNKRLINGQLFIEKNNVLYNAQGIQVR